MTRFVEATPLHADVMAEIHGRAFAEPWGTAAMARLLTMPAAKGWIAMVEENASEPAGAILIQMAGGEAEIITLGVRPEFRRRGIGRALVGRAADWAREQGAENLFLEVAVDNPSAETLYRAFGFAEAGRRPNYYDRGAGQRVDALILRLPLDIH